MDRRSIAAACIIGILICTAAFFLTRPITGTWVCTERLTESAMLTDEVTTITIRPDGTAEFRSYGDYLGRHPAVFRQVAVRTIHRAGLQRAGRVHRILEHI